MNEGIKKKRLAVIDYGMGNLHSVSSAAQQVAPEVEVVVSSDSSVIASADHVIFPGVGAIKDCMAEIRRLGFDRLVLELIASGRPILAICVGMQALMSCSEENGGVECLGFFEGEVIFFGDALCDAEGAKLKVPHMGWNQVKQEVKHPLWQGIPQNSRFYFVHSYLVSELDKNVVAGSCDYGGNFAAALYRDNVFTAQFHPEKSHTVGLQLLKNFISWDGCL